MQNDQRAQGDPLRLIEFARNRQLKRRRGAVHQSVPNPILVLVLGDNQCDQLDALYTQLTSRWSSQLGALQICYCYMGKRYEGGNPILQAEVAVAEEAAGAGCLCHCPEGMAAVNKMISQAIGKISEMPQVSMSRADIALVMGAEDPIAPLLTDIVAVARGWMDDFGTTSNESRLYLLLPQRYNTNAERMSACSTLDQIQCMEGNTEEGGYEQAVMLPQADAQPRVYKSRRLLNQVILLDELDEKYRRYNQHGERLQLLGDLIETEWSIGGYILTAGVQEASAGPEYWLAQAADILCEKVLREIGNGVTGAAMDPEPLCKEIEAYVPGSMPGYANNMGNCCLFLRGRVNQIKPSMTLEQAETGVFGSALSSAFQAWLDSVPQAHIPEKVQAILDEADSDIRLEELADRLRSWADKKENEIDTTPSQVTCRGFQPAEKSTEGEKVLLLRKYLLDNRYRALRNLAGNTRCAEIARKCADGCRSRIQGLKQENEEFEEFAQAIQETWYALRDAFNNGNPMKVTWTEDMPSLSAVRRAGARAIREKDPEPVLSMIADCIDLGGGAADSIVPADPPLFCRMTILLSANTKIQEIRQGISEGRVLKLTTVSDTYNEDAVCRAFALLKARNP